MGYPLAATQMELTDLQRAYLLEAHRLEQEETAKAIQRIQGGQKVGGAATPSNDDYWKRMAEMKKRRHR